MNDVTHSNPNKQVTEALTAYLDLSVPPLYALMLDGPWGSGKTHYVKEIIESIKFDNRKVIHISLYGLTSSLQIDQIIFQNLHPILGSKTAKFAERIIAGLASATIKYDLFSSGENDAEVKVSTPKFDVADFASKDVDHIMFFDDFERCGIDPKILLGYINYFVEHAGLKVIIAVNESEILTDSKLEYLKIKEKVVGLTYKIAPNVDSALVNFIDDLEPKALVEQIKKSFELIKNTFYEINYSNLRSLRQVLIQFQSLYKILPDKAKLNQEYFNEFIKLYLVVALENSNSALSESELTAIIDGKSMLDYMHENNNKNKDEIKTRKNELIKKYEGLRNLNITNQSSDFWSDLFIQKFVNVKLLDILIDSHHLFVNTSDKTPNWKKLWWWYKLKQNEFDDVVTKIEAELDNNSLGNVNEVLHACTLIANLITKKYYKKYDLITWTSKSKAYFEQLSGVNQFPISSDHRIYKLSVSRGYAGLGYESDGPYFNDFQTFANAAIERESKRISCSKSVELIDALNTSLEKFIEYVDDASRAYPRFPIFENINIEAFISKMNSFETPDEWRQFTSPIHDWFNNNTNHDKSVLVNKLTPYIERKLIESEGKIINQGVLIFKEHFINKN